MTRPGGDGLTPTQRRVLKAVRDHIAVRGFPPTLREIAVAVGLASPSTVSYQLDRLVDKGRLLREPDRPRALVVVEPPDVVRAG